MFSVAISGVVGSGVGDASVLNGGVFLILCVMAFSGRRCSSSTGCGSSIGLVISSIVVHFPHAMMCQDDWP